MHDAKSKKVLGMSITDSYYDAQYFSEKIIAKSKNHFKEIKK
jgi:hypothetical protein